MRSGRTEWSDVKASTAGKQGLHRLNATWKAVLVLGFWGLTWRYSAVSERSDGQTACLIYASTRRSLTRIAGSAKTGLCLCAGAGQFRESNSATVTM